MFRNLIVIFYFLISAPLFSMEIKSLRLRLDNVKSELGSHKKNEKLFFKSSKNLINQLKQKIEDHQLKKIFFAGLNVVNEEELELELKMPNVEFFSFKKEDQLFIDFWFEKKKVAPRPIVKTKVLKIKDTSKKKDSIKIKVAGKVKKKKSSIRDYRYGTPFVWDINPIKPKITYPINIKRKTPEALFPIRDRDISKGDREAHLQLTINMFRKRKYGLMYKSIELYDKKYPDNPHFSLHAFLKIVSEIKDNYLSGETSISKEMLARLEGLIEQVDDPDMKIALVEFCQIIRMEQKDYVSALRLAKKLFVLTKENIYPEKLKEALKTIFFSLAELGQIDKVVALVEDKEVNKYLSKRDVLDFYTYANLKKNKIQEIFRQKFNFIDQMPESLLFNLAEAHFRKGHLKKSIKLFDQFISQYGYSSRSSDARLRLAIASDLLNKDPKVVQQLYLDAMNRSSDPMVRYEASVRYVGIKFLRNKKIENPKDMSSFLVLPKDVVQEKISKNLKKILWMTRLRSLIVLGEYEDALKYFSNIPLKKLNVDERISFRKDIQEAILGKLQHLYSNEDYAGVISLSEEQIDGNLQIKSIEQRVLEAKSYIHLGVVKSIDEIIEEIKRKKNDWDYYPEWVVNHRKDFKYALSEIKIEHLINQKKYKEALKTLVSMKKRMTFENYLLSKVLFKMKKFKQHQKVVDDLIVRDAYKELSESNQSNLLNEYITSLLESKKKDKVLEIVESMMNSGSLDKINSEDLKHYLLLLINWMDGKLSYSKSIEKLFDYFKKNFSDSTQFRNAQYIFAKNLLENGQLEQGEENLTEIINDDKAKEYLKNLARSELSLLKIKDLTI